MICWGYAVIYLGLSINSTFDCLPIPREMLSDTDIPKCNNQQTDKQKNQPNIEPVQISSIFCLTGRSLSWAIDCRRKEG